MSRGKFSLLLLFLIGLLRSASAELRFEQPEQTFEAKPDQKAVIAHYKFTNTGPGSVEINAVKTSCGCTTAALAKTAYGPGESGDIAATFNIGGRVGAQEKAILVTLKGGSDKPITLRLNVNIEDPVTIQPQFVIWRVGEAPVTKTIHITVADDQSGKIISVTSDNPSIVLDLKEVKPGKEYEARLTPSDASQVASATILIKTDFPSENPQSRYAYARIK